MNEPNQLEQIKRNLKDQILGEDKAKVLQPGQTQCPNCKKVYVPEMPRGEGTPTQREMHITGICSDECWNQFLG